MTRVQPFALSVARLLDETGMFTREEWSELLGVPRAEIARWVDGAAIPRAEDLRSIVRVLESSDHVPREVLEEFYSVAGLPASEAIPEHSERVGRTIRDYMVEPLRDGFLRTLGTLDPVAQEKILTTASEMCVSPEFTAGATARKRRP